jgi:MoxR-like ATPase
MVLVDEINRATPRTQSALLEAMQEHQVTYAGRAHALSEPFCLLATQNPIEFEGTYPLPEAQLDRFMVKLKVGFPSRETLGRLVSGTLDEEPADSLAPVVPIDRMREMMMVARSVVLPEAVIAAAVDLVLATHPVDSGSEVARRRLRFGASPRALQSLLRLARVRALASGRGHVSLEDVSSAAHAALRHRLLLTMDSELEGVAVDSVLSEILEQWTLHS